MVGRASNGQPARLIGKAHQHRPVVGRRRDERDRGAVGVGEGLLERDGKVLACVGGAEDEQGVRGIVIVGIPVRQQQLPVRPQGELRVARELPGASHHRGHAALGLERGAPVGGACVEDLRVAATCLAVGGMNEAVVVHQDIHVVQVRAPFRDSGIDAHRRGPGGAPVRADQHVRVVAPPS